MVLDNITVPTFELPLIGHYLYYYYHGQVFHGNNCSRSRYRLENFKKREKLKPLAIFRTLIIELKFCTFMFAVHQTNERLMRFNM